MVTKKMYKQIQEFTVRCPHSKSLVSSRFILPVDRILRQTLRIKEILIIFEISLLDNKIDSRGILFHVKDVIFNQLFKNF